jgi:hypothetical protein
VAILRDGGLVDGVPSDRVNAMVVAMSPCFSRNDDEERPKYDAASVSFGCRQRRRFSAK